MNVFKKASAVLALGAALLVGGAATAADRDWAKYDGSVSIDAKQFALVFGGSTGGGKLEFQGKTYDFKVSGLTAGINVGITEVKGNGFVYDLKDVAKFPGTYTVYSTGGAAGAGAGMLHLKNENDVIMSIGTTSKGLSLNVASASGVKVTMK
jgi:hypothetical protein